MRKWIMSLGLVAAVVGAALLASRARSPATQVAAAPAEGPAPAAVAPHPAPADATPHPAPTPAQEPAPDPHAAMTGRAIDELAKAVLAYPVSMRKLEAYAAAVRELRAAAERDPALMARLRLPGPPGEDPAALAARLDTIAPLKSLLGRHGLVSLDLVLMPQAVASGRNAYGLEQEGRPLPPAEQNEAATGLFRTNRRRVDELSRAYVADLRAIGGR